MDLPKKGGDFLKKQKVLPFELNHFSDRSTMETPQPAPPAKKPQEWQVVHEAMLSLSKNQQVIMDFSKYDWFVNPENPLTSFTPEQEQSLVDLLIDIQALMPVRVKFVKFNEKEGHGCTYAFAMSATFQTCHFFSQGNEAIPALTTCDPAELVERVYFQTIIPSLQNRFDETKDPKVQAQLTSITTYYNEVCTADPWNALALSFYQPSDDSKTDARYNIPFSKLRKPAVAKFLKERFPTNPDTLVLYKEMIAQRKLAYFGKHKVFTPDGMKLSADYLTQFVKNRESKKNGETGIETPVVDAQKRPKEPKKKKEEKADDEGGEDKPKKSKAAKTKTTDKPKEKKSKKEKIFDTATSSDSTTTNDGKAEETDADVKKKKSSTPRKKKETIATVSSNSNGDLICSINPQNGIYSNPDQLKKYAIVFGCKMFACSEKTLPSLLCAVDQIRKHLDPDSKTLLPENFSLTDLNEASVVMLKMLASFFQTSQDKLPTMIEAIEQFRTTLNNVNSK